MPKAAFDRIGRAVSLITLLTSPVVGPRIPATGPSIRVELALQDMPGLRPYLQHPGAN